MIAFAAWRWLASLPRIVWAFAFCIALAALGLWFTYHQGDKHGALTVHRHALADSITKEDSVHTTAQTETDRARATARTAHRFADASRPKRQALRDSVEGMLKELPEPVVQLIHMDDQQIRRDSVALVAHAAFDTAFLLERATAAELDTLHQHQATVGIEPPKRHGVRTFVVGAAIGVASMLLLHAVR